MRPRVAPWPRRTGSTKQKTSAIGGSRWRPTPSRRRTLSFFGTRRRSASGPSVAGASSTRLRTRREGRKATPAAAARRLCGRRTKPHITLAELGVTKTQSSKWQQLAALPGDKFEIRVEHAKARVEGMTTSAPSYRTGANIPAKTNGSRRPTYIEAAREVLGEIDLDPATHPLAQQMGEGRRRSSPPPTTGSNSRGPAGCASIRPMSGELLAGFVDKLMAEHASGALNGRFCSSTVTPIRNGSRPPRGPRRRSAWRAAGFTLSRRAATTARRPCTGRRFSISEQTAGDFEQVFSAIGLIVRPA